MYFNSLTAYAHLVEFYELIDEIDEIDIKLNSLITNNLDFN